MNEVFGDYQEPGQTVYEYLQIGFSPSSISLQRRWRNNGLSADFLADYMSTFFPKDNIGDDRNTEIKDAISYIANELLENAMKYAYKPNRNSVSITMQMDDENIYFYVSNTVDPDSVTKFRNFIIQLLTEDTSELYMEMLMANADEEDAAGSGLGFLTMINDYDAKLGWQFDATEGAGAKMVTTMVRVAV